MTARRGLAVSVPLHPGSPSWSVGPRLGQILADHLTKAKSDARRDGK